MKHNPIRMQYDALVELRKEMSDDDFRYLINCVWFGIDDLTHDGYSVVDYEESIDEAINEYGDVLQIDDADDLRQVVNDPDRYTLEIEGQAADSNASMEYMRKLADAVDAIYAIYGPFYSRFEDGETNVQFNPLSGPFEDADLTHIMRG